MVLMNLSSITPILISSATLRDDNAKGLACRIQDAEELSPENLPSWKLIVFLDEVPWMKTRKSDFVQDNYGDDENFWTNRIDSSMHRAWTEFAFEHLCMNHISQI